MYVWMRAVRRCSWRGGKENSYGSPRASERTIMSHWTCFNVTKNINSDSVTLKRDNIDM